MLLHLLRIVHNNNMETCTIFLMLGSILKMAYILFHHRNMRILGIIHKDRVLHQIEEIKQVMFRDIIIGLHSLGEGRWINRCSKRLNPIPLADIRIKILGLLILFINLAGQLMFSRVLVVEGLVECLPQML